MLPARYDDDDDDDDIYIYIYIYIYIHEDSKLAIFIDSEMSETDLGCER